MPDLPAPSSLTDLQRRPSSDADDWLFLRFVVEYMQEFKDPARAVQLRDHIVQLQRLVVSHPSLEMSEVQRLTRTNVKLFDFFDDLQQAVQLHQQQAVAEKRPTA